ncbi:DMT family transporter [Pseudomonas sp. VS38]|uniref:DMT family transporter n=1 Tax=Pseudomonas sp. VS38 TaxID=2834066 RepID=UPI00203261BF|nr:DMT family transporter [Pseudomonas sp. VS38]
MSSLMRRGMVLGLIFCFISAAFDVYVAFVTQMINPLVVIFYCFSFSGAFFLSFTLLRSNKKLILKLCENILLVFLVNVAVLLNWGGLFYALRYLEPAVVGVASVACGPALTLIISALDKNRVKTALADTLISWLVLISVGIMLFKSFMGDSGVSSTTTGQRMLGIVSVLVCALGTVMYTIVSKKLFARQWVVYEILAVRNVVMIIACVVLIPATGVGFALGPELFWPMLTLVVIGHLLPIYLIQKTIHYLSAIHVSLLLLTLPVFVLLLQYLDTRVEFSAASVTAVGVIIFLLSGRAIASLYLERRGLR